MTRYAVALRDPLSGRYGTAVGYKADSPAEAVILRIKGRSARRRTTLTVADVEHLGGERYRVGERYFERPDGKSYRVGEQYFRVRVSS